MAIGRRQVLTGGSLAAAATVVGAARMNSAVASQAGSTVYEETKNLQTLQDFPRWKAQGVLLPYKPAGFSRIHPAFKDRDGAWTGPPTS